MSWGEVLAITDMMIVMTVFAVLLCSVLYWLRAGVRWVAQRVRS